VKQKLIIGTRSSELALWQADYVAEQLREHYAEEYPDLVIEKKLITTKGDKVLDAPLAKIGGKGLFTKELEQAMLDGQIDMAVHSLKDMPTALPEGLTLAAITKRGGSGDAFVSHKYAHFYELPRGAKVGTSSLRRQAQLLHVRPDLQIESLRGNVLTRLKKLDNDEFDAIILAVAGLKRLGYSGQITEVLPKRIMLPAVGQGALAIETRADDQEMIQAVDFLNDEQTVACAQAERSFLARVEGGCQVPVGVYAEPEVQFGQALNMSRRGNMFARAVYTGRIKVEAVIASLDGKRLYRSNVQGQANQARQLGRQLADELLDQGGLAIMHELGLLLDRQ